MLQKICIRPLTKPSSHTVSDSPLTARGKLHYTPTTTMWCDASVGYSSNLQARATNVSVHVFTSLCVCVASDMLGHLRSVKILSSCFLSTEEKCITQSGDSQPHIPGEKY